MLKCFTFALLGVFFSIPSLSIELDLSQVHGKIGIFAGTTSFGSIDYNGYRCLVVVDELLKHDEQNNFIYGSSVLRILTETRKEATQSTINNRNFGYPLKGPDARSYDVPLLHRFKYNKDSMIDLQRTSDESLTYNTVDTVPCVPPSSKPTFWVESIESVTISPSKVIHTRTWNCEGTEHSEFNSCEF